MARQWTNEEIDYLKENWGEVSIKIISKNVDRNENAVLGKAYNLGLNSCYSSGNYLNANLLSQIMGVDNHCVVDYWIKKCGLEAKRKVLRELKVWCISIKDLVKWLEKNQDKWDSKKVDLPWLGNDLPWLSEKRKEDMNLPKRHYTSWTKEEEALLISYYKYGKSQKEISLTINRTRSSVQRKISRLKENGSLQKIKIMCHWSLEEEELLKQLEAKGLDDTRIAEELGRERTHITDHRRNLKLKGLYEGRKNGGDKVNEIN